MARIFSFLLWTTVFLLLLIGFDQLLVRVPASLPAHVAVATFYRDLRSRLFGLAGGPAVTLPARQPAVRPGVTAPALPGTISPAPPASVEAIIEQRQPAAVAPLPTAARTSGKAVRGASPRYVFADDKGELHFAETLAEIPEQYRAKARGLGE